jgi:hypothetical protein
LKAASTGQAGLPSLWQKRGGGLVNLKLSAVGKKESQVFLHAADRPHSIRRQFSLFRLKRLKLV